jgi:hypothetical protein
MPKGINNKTFKNLFIQVSNPISFITHLITFLDNQRNRIMIQPQIYFKNFY